MRREKQTTAGARARKQDTPAAGVGPQERRGDEWFALLALALVVVTLLVYMPAWKGKFLWDDPAHVTARELRSLRGLGRIWFDLDATQQYYPLLHSAFWVQHRLWGDSTLGYHLVNIALHAAAAVMVAMILRRLEVPGAYFAAAIFALHPVCVESVAWITELKNTLSAVFYLGAALAYLRFDATRRRGPYALAAALFVMGLMSKTVTATLPAALLVVFWWKRGRLSLRRDVVPLLGFFAVGAAAGLFTAWVERNRIGAEGAEFAFTAIERCLIAGRVVWFYLGKLLWPARLTFIYPRWHVSQAVWWQYLFPAAAVALLVVLFVLRRRSRAPLAAMLFFVGTLFPVLGFFNVYPFKFSLVADHFQYLPSLGVFTLAAAGFALLLKRLERRQRIAACAAGAAVLAALAVLTWRQSRIYVSNESLFRATIARNDESWLAHNQLGRALEKDPDRVGEAERHFRRAVQIKPLCAEAHCNLGLLLAVRGEFEEALKHLNKALQIDPRFAVAQSNLAYVRIRQGKVDEAIELLGRALREEPNLAVAHVNLGSALAAKGGLARAAGHFRRALQLDPNSAEARKNLRDCLELLRQVDEAIDRCRAALRAAPDDAARRCELARALEAKDLIDQAADQYRRVLSFNRDHLEACNSLARLLATEPALAGGDPAEAVAMAERACRLTANARPAFLDTLAAAYANQGMFSKAVETAQRAIELAEASGRSQLADGIRVRLKLYQADRPYRLGAP